MEQMEGEGGWGVFAGGGGRVQPEPNCGALQAAGGTLATLLCAQEENTIQFMYPEDFSDFLWRRECGGAQSLWPWLLAV